MYRRKTYTRRQKKLVASLTVRGECTFSTNGLGFVRVLDSSSSRDLILPASQTKTILHNDLLRLKINSDTQKRRNRSAQVLEILQRRQTYYRLQLLNKLNPTDWQAIVLDQPHLPRALVTITKEHKKKRLLLTWLCWWRPVNKNHSSHFQYPKTTTTHQTKWKRGQVIIAQLSKQCLRSTHQKLSFFYIGHEHSHGKLCNLQRVLIRNNLHSDHPTSFDVKNSQLERQLIKNDQGRIDLQALYTITIDGETTKDFDDALSIELLNNKFLLYVHIADVAAYINVNDKLDREALRRGTSVYPGPFVMHMLPEQLSENLCSLQENVSRRTLTVELTVDYQSGKTISARFYRSKICVDRRLTYSQTDTMLYKYLADTKASEQYLRAFNNKKMKNNKHGINQLESALRLLHGLVNRKEKNQSHDPRLIFQLDSVKPADLTTAKSKLMLDFQRKKQISSMQIIETCMIAANTAVAEFMHRNEVSTIYRNHPPLQKSKTKNFLDICKLHGLHPPNPFINKGQINKFIASLQKKVPNPLLRNFFQVKLIQSLEAARYDSKKCSHWGLSLNYYCHFTSPIRRYPDLVVHRTLTKFFKKVPVIHSRQKLKQHDKANNYKAIAIHLSEQERKAMEAERLYLRLEMLDTMSIEKIKVVQGVLSAVKNESWMFMLMDYPAVLAEVSKREPKRYHRNRKTKPPLSLGTIVQLHIKSIDKENLKVLCTLANSK